ncbi:MAG: hypothetical protein ACFCUQ_00350 [Kiloniellales bacterium]
MVEIPFYYRLGAPAVAPGTELSPALTLALPLLFVAAPIATFLAAPDYEIYARWFVGEHAFIEIVTVLVALWGLCHAVRALRQRALFPRRFLAVWMGLFAVGFIYIAGEEASWGQHWLGFATPDWLESLNRQGEVNIHNLTKAGDRLPKTLIGAALVVGGLLGPLFFRWRGIRFGGPDDWRWWIWPTAGITPLAAIFLVVWICDRTAVQLEIPPERGGDLGDQEIRELLLAYFLMLYCFSIDRRLSLLRGVDKARKSLAV